MTTLLLILAALLILAGIAGAVLPILPGPPIAFLGLVALHYASPEYAVSSNVFWIMGSLAVVITVLDYVVPVYGTKRFGGTKWGTNGSTVGLLVGIFGGAIFGPLAPLAIVLGPFFGAVIGELMGGATNQNALRSGFGAFFGFLAGVFMKAAYAIGLLVYFIIKLF